MALGALVLGCGSDGTKGGTDPDDEDVEGPVRPLYAYVQTTAEEKTYASLTRTADIRVGAPEIDRRSAHEMESRDVRPAGKQLLEFVGSSARQWKIDEEMNWEEGDTLDLSDYPLPDGADPASMFFVDEHTVYLQYDVTKRVVFDPTEMEVVADMTDSQLEAEVDGLALSAGGNWTDLTSDGATLAPFHYSAQDGVHFGEKSSVAVYDRDTHEETRVVDVPCPGLSITTRDEDGYTYFSTLSYSPLLALFEQGPKPCVARLTPDSELDESFTTDLTELTGGKYSAKFHYIADGWGIMDVLDHDALGFDRDAEIPENAIDEVRKRENWSLWLVDLKEGSARPLDELEDDLHPLYWWTVQFDGRTFLRLVKADRTQTTYELKERNAYRLDEVTNGTARWFRVR